MREDKPREDDDQSTWRVSSFARFNVAEYMTALGMHNGIKEAKICP